MKSTPWLCRIGKDRSSDSVDYIPRGNALGERTIPHCKPWVPLLQFLSLKHVSCPVSHVCCTSAACMIKGACMHLLSVAFCCAVNVLLIGNVTVCSSVISHWAAEIERFSPKLTVCVYHGTQDERAQAWNRHVRPVLCTHLDSRPGSSQCLHVSCVCVEVTCIIVRSLEMRLFAAGQARQMPRCPHNI